ncbi:MAG: GTP-binding protein, partial [Clostridiaceae bacterium]|nr:GTP-binding protein [Clostridiaceae bacterium]
MSLQSTPRADRVHIGIFGLRNSGKSSLINALTGQNIAIVSDVAGTTTDPVYKSMEVHGIGPCVFIDTAGFDDVGAVGELRNEKTQTVIDKTDIAIMVIDPSVSLSQDASRWLDALKATNTPIIAVLNKVDLYQADSSDYSNKYDQEMTTSQINKSAKSAKSTKSTKLTREANIVEKISQEIADVYDIPVIPVSTITREGIDLLREQLIRSLPADFESDSITGKLANEGDMVLLVMPQDIQAPKGRLILPQVQVIRELLDKKCIVQCVTTDKLDEGLAALASPPNLIITDSQVFRTVYDKKPEESMLTSFSVLLAGYKGNIQYFVDSAYAIEG